MKERMAVSALILMACELGYGLGALPDGHWQGKGQARMQSGEHATYTERARIKNNVLTSELDFGGQKFGYMTKATFAPNGFLDVAITDDKGKMENGTGYCASVWCHWQSASGKFEMTIVFDGDKVYEIGSDVEQGQRGWFETSLVKVP